MVLVTSGQVSLILSTAVVFFFTLALFLSGYVLQQRTLSSLREAIKPKPRAAHPIYLPARFDTGSDSTKYVQIDLGRAGSDTGGDQKFLRVNSDADVYSDQGLTPVERSTESARISKAERRRRIKEDIEKLSSVTENSGYQRRLW